MASNTPSQEGAPKADTPASFPQDEEDQSRPRLDAEPALPTIDEWVRMTPKEQDRALREAHRWDRRREMQGILEDVMDDAEEFLGKRGLGFDVNRIRREFDTTFREAQWVAAEAWTRYQAEDNYVPPPPRSRGELLGAAERLALEIILAHPEGFQNTRHRFDAETIRRHFRLTVAQGRFLAKAALEAAAKTPPAAAAAPPTPAAPPASPAVRPEPASPAVPGGHGEAPAGVPA